MLDIDPYKYNERRFDTIIAKNMSITFIYNILTKQAHRKAG